MIEHSSTDGVAVVTGASRGIGRAVALELGARGLEVVATMRDPDAGRSLLAEADAAGSTLRVARLDVTRADEFDVPEGLRVLVNSAGVRLRYLPVEETPLDEWRETFETNVFGLAELTRRALPVLRRTADTRRAEGRSGVVVCNVSSSSILLPHPFMGTYRASKAAVSALCDSLRLELAPFGIRVVEILPGPIGTDLLHDSLMMRPPEAVEFEPYRHLGERQYAVSRDALPYVTSPADAAKAIVDAVLAGAVLADDAAGPTDALPMRVGCDPISVDQLAHWRGSSDEQLAAEVAGRLGLAR
jgi:NAD(P)-dependent dehydrogenase (short-subunit alcohol dehydrogenase family)